MITKLIAAMLVKKIMLEAASDKNEETIKLVKKPGEKGSTRLEVNVNFNCMKDRIPMYCEKIVVSAAHATNVSYEEMLKHLATTHELIGEISKEESTQKTREVSDEDQQDQQPDHDAGARQQG